MSAKRGPYRKCYLVPHGRGFKYVRAIPKDLQAIEQKQAWVKYLGPVSRSVAETMAHAWLTSTAGGILAFRGQATDGLAAATFRGSDIGLSVPWADLPEPGPSAATTPDQN